MMVRVYSFTNEFVGKDGQVHYCDMMYTSRDEAEHMAHQAGLLPEVEEIEVPLEDLLSDLNSLKEAKYREKL